MVDGSKIIRPHWILVVLHSFELLLLGFRLMFSQNYSVSFHKMSLCVSFAAGPNNFLIKNFHNWLSKESNSNIDNINFRPCFANILERNKQYIIVWLKKTLKTIPCFLKKCLSYKSQDSFLCLLVKLNVYRHTKKLIEVKCSFFIQNAETNCCVPRLLHFES